MVTFQDGIQVARGAVALVQDQMCIKQDDSVVLTTDTATDRQAVEAIMRAAQEVGAKIGVIVLPRLPYQGALADPYVPLWLEAAVKNCDVWIDITFPYLAGSHAHDEAMKTNKLRFILAAGLRAQGLADLYGKVNLDALYEIHAIMDDIINGALGKECRITNPAGTDVTFTVAKPGFVKRRRASQPGLNTPPASTVMYPDPKSVRGKIVLETVFHEYYTRLAEPIVVKLDGGIREVSGGGSERWPLDRALRRACGDGYGSVIHFTYAYNPAAHYAGVSFLEDARAMGNNAVGLGLPWWEPGGGENHPDAILSMQSIWIAGQQIVKDGVLVGPAKLAELGGRLAPIV